MLNKKIDTNPRKANIFLYATLTMAFVILAAVVASAQPRRTAVTRLAQEGNKETASVMLQGGRDLITDQQWSKAEEYSTTYPAEKNLDAALYWMAYAQFQLSKYDQCKSTLTRLLNAYQNSSWKEDARTLLAQLPGSYSGAAGTSSGVGIGIGSGSGVAPAVTEVYTVREGSPVAVAVPAPRTWVYSTGDEGERGADDDPCEFKIVVLQALFQSDVQRGISTATEWLSNGSTQTVRCKGAALSLPARNGGKAVTPVILGVAQREPDMKLRARAISALGMTNDDSVIDPLRDFAMNSQENTIVEAALYSLGQHTAPRAITVLGEIAMSNTRPTNVRKLAIGSIASRPGEPAVDTLLRFMTAIQT